MRIRTYLSTFRLLLSVSASIPILTICHDRRVGPLINVRFLVLTVNAVLDEWLLRINRLLAILRRRYAQRNTFAGTIQLRSSPWWVTLHFLFLVCMHIHVIGVSATRGSFSDGDAVGLHSRKLRYTSSTNHISRQATSCVEGPAEVIPSYYFRFEAGSYKISACMRSTGTSPYLRLNSRHFLWNQRRFLWVHSEWKYHVTRLLQIFRQLRQCLYDYSSKLNSVDCPEFCHRYIVLFRS